MPFGLPFFFVLTFCLWILCWGKLGKLLFYADKKITIVSDTLGISIDQDY